MPFGQVVIGPPGSGKTTFCFGMQQMLHQLERKPIIVNLDPANENIPYECQIDLKELIQVEQVMKEKKLGPNGALLYCMRYLQENFDWLEKKLELYPNSYFLFDIPGQVELSTNDDSLLKIIRKLEKIGFKLACVHLVDAAYCSDPAKYISVLLLCLKAMIFLELPHINVLSKMDLIDTSGDLDFNLDFYTQVLDLNYLNQRLDQDPFSAKFTKLNKAITELIQDYNLVNFETLCIEDKDSVVHLLHEIDKANGYVFGALTDANESIMQVANTIQPDRTLDTESKYLN